MSSNRTINPSSLSLKDLPWQIDWKKDRCTLCGQCAAVCPVQAIELGVFRKRNLVTSIHRVEDNRSTFDTFYGIKQRTTIEEACIGCAMCAMVCPNDAIEPKPNPGTPRLTFHVNQGGEPRKRGGRRNSTDSLLDRIKFIRISMLTDPALDAGRHEFEMRTLLGRVLPPKENMLRFKTHGWIPPVREIYPLIIGGMSFGALFPHHVGRAADGGGLFK